jgi:GTPase SAR1 family protein
MEEGKAEPERELKTKPIEGNDLFALGEQMLSEGTGTDSGLSERTIVVVGDKGSGKSTLINALIGQKNADGKAPKPTVALHYTFGRKKVEGRKELGNFYELGGGRHLQNLVTVPFSASRYEQSVFLIVIDMAKPGSALSSLTHWLQYV